MPSNKNNHSKLDYLSKYLTSSTSDKSKDRKKKEKKKTKKKSKSGIETSSDRHVALFDADGDVGAVDRRRHLDDDNDDNDVDTNDDIVDDLDIPSEEEAPVVVELPDETNGAYNTNRGGRGFWEDAPLAGTQERDDNDDKVQRRTSERGGGRRPRLDSDDEEENEAKDKGSFRRRHDSDDEDRGGGHRRRRRFDSDDESSSEDDDDDHGRRRRTVHRQDSDSDDGGATGRHRHNQQGRHHLESGRAIKGSIDESLQRKRHDSDSDSRSKGDKDKSLRRRRHDSSEDEDEDRQKRRRRDLPYKNGSERESAPDVTRSTKGHTAPRRKRYDSDDESGDSKDDDGRARMSSGHKAGLQGYQDFNKSEQKIQAQKHADAQKMVDKYGMGETVYRNKDGRKTDPKGMEKARSAAGMDAAEAQRRLNEGKVQRETQEAQAREMAALQQSTFARHKDDHQLEEHLKNAIRKDDPMAEYASRKQGKSIGASPSGGYGSMEASKPVYKGPPPRPNRYGIRPGYRWDGVDRGNGFEDKLLAKQYSSVQKQEQAYRWSSADM